MSENLNSTYQFLPLTFSQRTLWMGQKLFPKSPMYNMAFTFEINFDIAINIFRQSFANLVEACDCMRSTFEEKDGIPIQIINKELPYNLEYIDHSHDSSPFDWKLWAKKRSTLLVDISYCLFDSALIKLDDNKYIWYFNQHHLITDAWATTLQINYFWEVYNSLKYGDEKPMVTLPSFEDYIAYEKNQSQLKSKEKVRNYWREKSKNLPDFPRFFQKENKELVSESERISFCLTEDQKATLNRLSKDKDLKTWTEDLSYFNIFSTLLFILIYRLTSQKKLAIGAPTHCRNTSDFRKTPGIFIELFPIQINIEDNDSFLSVFKKVQKENFEFLKNAGPGVNNQNLMRGYNVIFNYINASFKKSHSTEIESNWIHSGYADPAHHMRLQIDRFSEKNEIILAFDLNKAVFSKKTRAYIPAYYQDLMTAFFHDKNQKIGEVSFNIKKELHIKNHAFKTPFNGSLNVMDLWRSSVINYPNRTAIVGLNQKLSYYELDQKINGLARYLIDHGLGKNNRIGLFLKRSVEYVISVFACLKIGAVFIPIPSDLPSGRILGLIDDAQLHALISTSIMTSLLPKKIGTIIHYDIEAAFFDRIREETGQCNIAVQDLAYIMYTSGSTGKPKGVMITHEGLSHYIQWSMSNYLTPEQQITAPFFTSIGFDLTITSLFLPLISGGKLVIYPETEKGPDLALLDILADNKVDFIKLTPSHISMVHGKDISNCLIKTMILGGENLKGSTAKLIFNVFGEEIKIFNEYGPTESTVGCIVHQLDQSEIHSEKSIPIGIPLPNTPLMITDVHGHSVTEGTIGELIIGGIQVAPGYWKNQELTDDKFYIEDDGTIFYKSGDLVRIHPSGYLEYHGRKDDQIKINGRRIETGEIEAIIEKYPGINECIVELRKKKIISDPDELENCVRCGLPSNYPNVDFNDSGICSLCQNFEDYQEKVHSYFKTEDDLIKLFNSVQGHNGEYDAIVLLSGGKDSTYTLAKVKELGLKILSFTLDNGYISEEAKDNIRKVVTDLGVDHIFGRTPAMNDIFVDSLERHYNVCDGCFKTIYTLSIQLAIEKKIPFIITGLSRGQFFETRLTEELFQKEVVDVDQIDQMILNARLAYHQVDDAVKRLLNTEIFEDSELFNNVRIIDYFRYSDVSLDKMLVYLEDSIGWVRPTDTGRSTNCLINKAGIYIHKKELGYSNYAFPYSWDVRVGHKTRKASLEEINEEIDENEVQVILDEIGYTVAHEFHQDQNHLVAYYTSDQKHLDENLQNHLKGLLPDYMIPQQFIPIDAIPLTVNGKIDKNALPIPDHIRPVLSNVYHPPGNEFEEIIHDIWSKVLLIKNIGIHDQFLDIGGDSLSGIRIMSRLSNAFELDLSVRMIFQYPTINKLSDHIQIIIKNLLSEMENNIST